MQYWFRALSASTKCSSVSTLKTASSDPLESVRGHSPEHTTCRPNDRGGCPRYGTCCSAGRRRAIRDRSSSPFADGSQFLPARRFLSGRTRAPGARQDLGVRVVIATKYEPAV